MASIAKLSLVWVLPLLYRPLHPLPVGAEVLMFSPALGMPPVKPMPPFSYRRGVGCALL